MLTGVEILVWLIRENANSCIDVGESSSKGHEAVRKPLSDAEDQILLNATWARKTTQFKASERNTLRHGAESYAAYR